MTGIHPHHSILCLKLFLSLSFLVFVSSFMLVECHDSTSKCFRCHATKIFSHTLVLFIPMPTTILCKVLFSVYRSYHVCVIDRFDLVQFNFTAWKMSIYGVISGLYFLEFGLNTGKYGPEITPYFETLHAVLAFSTWVMNMKLYPKFNGKVQSPKQFWVGSNLVNKPSSFCERNRTVNVR